MRRLSAIISASKKRKRSKSNRKDNAGSSSTARNLFPDERANQIIAKFPSDTHYFSKNVKGASKLTIPISFCKHLPTNNCTLTLVGDYGTKYPVNYLFSDNHRLTAGWKEFVTAHKLVRGDLLVFQLIKKQKRRLKVYIVRANESDLDVSEGLGQDGSCGEDFGGNNLSEDAEGSGQYVFGEEDLGGNDLSVDGSDGLAQDGFFDEDFGENDLSRDGLEGLGPDVCEEDLGGNNFCSPSSFKIMADDYNIDLEIPPQIRTKYYNLCCSQGSYLHDSLFPSLSYKFVAAAIIETARISDEIRASKIFTPLEYLETSHSTLKAFEILGLKVAFLRARLGEILRIRNLKSEFEALAKGERSIEMSIENKLKALACTQW